MGVGKWDGFQISGLTLILGAAAVRVITDADTAKKKGQRKMKHCPLLSAPSQSQTRRRLKTTYRAHRPRTCPWRPSPATEQRVIYRGHAPLGERLRFGEGGGGSLPGQTARRRRRTPVAAEGGHDPSTRRAVTEMRAAPQRAAAGRRTGQGALHALHVVGL